MTSPCNGKCSGRTSNVHMTTPTANSISVTLTSNDTPQYPVMLFRTFVWGIQRSLVNSPHKGQWRGALMFSLICTWINRWVNNREAGDLRRHRAHYDVIVIKWLVWNTHPNIYNHFNTWFLNITDLKMDAMRGLYFCVTSVPSFH